MAVPTAQRLAHLSSEKLLHAGEGNQQRLPQVNMQRVRDAECSVLSGLPVIIVFIPRLGSLWARSRKTMGAKVVDDLGTRRCLPGTASCTVNSLQLSQHEQNDHAQDRQSYSMVWGGGVSEREGPPPSEMLLTFGSC